jgi:hypothetical protein
MVECIRYTRVPATLPGPKKRRNGRFCALRARTEAPYKTDFHRENAKERLGRVTAPGRARTVAENAIRIEVATNQQVSPSS